MRTLTEQAKAWPTPRARISYLKWRDRWMALADHFATWSKDPSTKVGCVIVDDERKTMIGHGYNGFPRGVEDSAERLNDRPTKYLMVQHAEANAIFQCVAPPTGMTAYVTHRPCANCTGILIQAGIRRIVTRRPEPALAERFADSFAASDVMLHEAGVTIEFV